MTCGRSNRFIDYSDTAPQDFKSKLGDATHQYHVCVDVADVILKNGISLAIVIAALNATIQVALSNNAYLSTICKFILLGIPVALMGIEAAKNHYRKTAEDLILFGTKNNFFKLRPPEIRTDPSDNTLLIDKTDQIDALRHGLGAH